MRLKVRRESGPKSHSPVICGRRAFPKPTSESRGRPTVVLATDVSSRLVFNELRKLVAIVLETAPFSVNHRRTDYDGTNALIDPSLTRQN